MTKTLESRQKLQLAQNQHHNSNR